MKWNLSGVFVALVLLTGTGCTDRAALKTEVKQSAANFLQEKWKSLKAIESAVCKPTAAVATDDSDREFTVLVECDYSYDVAFVTGIGIARELIPSSQKKSQVVHVIIDRPDMVLTTAEFDLRSDFN